jgi:UDP-2,3-diacylglucosamine pyrophosphatase LpxH
MFDGLARDLYPLALSEGPQPEDPESPLRYRTLWISDVHLGTWGSKTENLVDFLRHHSADTIYLVGDLVDGWRLRSHWHWPQSHNDLVQKLLRLARKGKKIIYIPGNHDEAFRAYLGLSFGGVILLGHAVHRTADGKRLLVLHGDEFDGILLYAKWISRLGAVLYDLLVLANHGFNFLRRKLGFPYWSLSAFVKHKVKNLVAFTTRFEQVLLREARKRGVDGVVCGHIHKADLRTVEGLVYANTGDWIESCTALAEHFDGRLELVTWAEIRGPVAKPASAA